MKEGFIFGLMLGGLAGIALHKYCKNVQRMADKGEKMIIEEVEMIQKESKQKSAPKKQSQAK
ncbi:MAG: hypothetical protein MR423_00230 [Firmicutes bacterium]|nr:hypothetical protein [Bacillota bacterium]MDY3658752.1 hypothetical protein [Eubacteriales bacterium]